MRAVDRFLDENQDSLRVRFAAEAPWWLPESVEDRLFVRLIDGARRLAHDVAANPNHELRRQADARIRRLVDELRTWVSTVWRDIKASLRDQADDPSSELRRRLADAVCSLGQRLRDDPGLSERTDKALETGVRYVAEQFDEEVAAMVSNTISRWDGRETADRLELLLGPDLQFIRINGTVVGGLAGLAIYSIAQALS